MVANPDSSAMAVHGIAVVNFEEGDAMLSANAAGVSSPGVVTETQDYLRSKLVALDESWELVERRGIRHLNRRFGIRSTTEALQAMVEEVRDGLVANNPFALLWAVAEDRSMR